MVAQEAGPIDMILEADFRVRRGSFVLDARFEAPASGVIAVVGPSGAGKSLLLSAIAGLASLDDGRLLLGSRVFEDAGLKRRIPAHRRGVGLVFQDARLLPHLTVRGNLLYAWKRAPKAKLSPDEAADHFDIRDLIDRPVRNLSGGEKSRVALARAILSAPDMLLLDEPFAALDGPRRQTFVARLKDLHRTFGLPMAVVTHQIDDAATLAQFMIALNAGAVTAAGPLQEATQSPAFQSLLDRRDTGVAISIGDDRTVWARSDHVLLSNVEPVGLSARHVWRGEITAIDKEPEGAFLVTVAAPQGRIRARVTPAAVSDLGLAAGRCVWAIIKEHAL